MRSLKGIEGFQSQKTDSKTEKLLSYPVFEDEISIGFFLSNIHNEKLIYNLTRYSFPKASFFNGDFINRHFLRVSLIRINHQVSCDLYYYNSKGKFYTSTNGSHEGPTLIDSLFDLHSKIFSTKAPESFQDHNFNKDEIYSAA